MPVVTAPEAVVASFICYPLTFPNGRKIFQIETSRRFWSDTAPLLRDASNKPFALTEEIGIGSVVQIALAADGTMRAIKVLAVAWDDPFAEAAD